MKKSLSLIAIAAIIFYSCKKEQGLTTKAPSVKKYAVHIQVTNFTVNHANFALRTKGSHLASSSDTLTDLASYVDLFYYVVLDPATLHVVKTIVQDSTYCSTMGMINDSLAAGNYVIVMIAGKKGLEVAPPGAIVSVPMYGYAGQPWQGSFWTAYPNGYIGLPWQDAFEYEYRLTVGTQNIDLTATLNRVVGKLEVTLLDPIPANADSLSISVYGAGPAVAPGVSNLRVTTNFKVGIPELVKGQPNFTIDRLLLDNTHFALPSDRDSITITCKDAGGNVLGNATVTHVTITANQKTILSGNLFKNSSPQSFTAVVDTAWSSGVTQVGFSLKHH